MKRLRKWIGVLFTGVVLIWITPVNAANWSGSVKIESIRASQLDSLGVWVKFGAPPYPNHTCSDTSGEYMLGGSVANVEKMSALATAALVNSRSVSVYWDGSCSGGGTAGYPVLRGLTIK
jgi:hypothetical protein